MISMTKLILTLRDIVKKHRVISSIVVFVAILCICIAICVVFLLNDKSINKNNEYIFIYNNENFEQLSDTLERRNVIKKNSLSYKFFSHFMKLDKNVKVGHYLIKSNTPMLKVVRSLRNGEQDPMKVTINSLRTKEDFAKKVSQKLLVSEKEIIDYCDSLNYTYSNQIFFDILTDTYQFYWNASCKTIFNRLKNVSDSWWNKQESSLNQIGLTKQEVIIIASIVQQETTKNDEKPLIAGVYINRLKKGMLLQADPTVKFALGNFSLKRIRSEHLKFDSPFNTYIYKGLPPAPICLPEMSSIKAVLHYSQHNYLYFCAKEDFSGYHNFATTLQEHNANANKYHRALNQKNIK